MREKRYTYRWLDDVNRAKEIVLPPLRRLARPARHRHHMHVALVLARFPGRVLRHRKSLQHQNVPVQHRMLAGAERRLQTRRHERRLECEGAYRQQKTQMQKMLRHPLDATTPFTRNQV